VFRDSRAILDQSAEVNVTVRDLSDGGARLIVPSGAKFPPFFKLQIGEETSPLSVRLCWQSANQLGVQFISPEKADELQRSLAQPRPEDEQYVYQPKQPAAEEPQLSNSQITTSRLLTPEYQLSFEFVPSQVGHSYCVVDVSLRKWGEIGAIHPFLCVPALGLNLEPAMGWEAREIYSLRKMIRFGSIADRMLPSSGRTGCCRIILPFAPDGGGHVGYATGTEHRLTQLPDIRLSCQVGAANFPSERLTLIIPASHIAGLILDHIDLDREMH
jgi:hypothetical protein